MNKVLFDGTALQTSISVKFHGGSEYAKCVLTTALQQGKIFDIVFDKNMDIDSSILQKITENHAIQVFWVEKKNDIYKLLSEYEYDIFYSALPYKYEDYNCSRTKFIMVIHGLRPLELPWDFYRYKYVNNILKKILFYLFSFSPYLIEKKQQKHLKRLTQLLSVQNKLIVTVSTHSKFSLLFSSLS